MTGERILDALLAASATSSLVPRDGARLMNFAQELLDTFGSGTDDSMTILDEVIGDDVGSTIPQFLQRIRKKLLGTEGPSSHAVLASAELLLHRRKRRGLIRGIANLGANLVINGVALKGHRGSLGAPPWVPNIRSLSKRYSPIDATEADALLFARTIVAALKIEGCTNREDLPWIGDGLQQCGVSAEEADWIERQFDAPVCVDGIAKQVLTTETALRLYTATSLAIGPSRADGKSFLGQLASALKLSSEMKEAVDHNIGELRTESY